MNTPEQLPDPQESRAFSLIIMVGCIAIAEVFAYVGIDAIKTGAPEEVLSSIVDGGFVVGATFVAAREWVKMHRPTGKSDL